jgi:hypothetical protein
MPGIAPFRKEGAMAVSATVRQRRNADERARSRNPRGPRGLITADGDPDSDPMSFHRNF